MSFRFPLRATAIASSTALLAFSSHAQAPTPSSVGTLPTLTVEASADASATGLPKPYAGGQVARGGRIGILGNQDVMDTPFSLTNYTQQFIADQQAPSIGDVLLNDPAVRMARGFGNFQQTYFIRGFPVASDDVAYNGLYGLVPRQYMASEFVERVEVFRGASAFLNGAGSGAVAGGGIGGLINVVPKRAGSEALNEVTLGVQNNAQGYAGADIARRFGPNQSAGIRLNAAVRDGGTGVDDEKNQLGVFAVGLDWHNATTRLSADFGYQNQKLKRTQPSVTLSDGLPVPRAPDASRNFAQPWTYSNERDTFGTVRGEFDISPNVTAWAAIGTRNGTEDASFAPPTLLDLNGSTTSYRFDNHRKDEISTGEAGLRAKLRTGNIGHTLTLSASAFRSESKVNYAMSGYFGNNLYAPFPVLAPATPFTGDFNETIHNSSIALADTLSFWDDRVLLTVGARRQRIKDETSGWYGGSYDEAKTTPVAGIVFKATPQWSIYGNYIEGLTKGDVASGVNIVNQGQVFAPYKSKQKEAGLKYDGGKFGGSLAYFTTDKPSAFVQDGIYGVYGKQRNQGIELSMFGEPAKGLRLLGGFTWLDAEQVRGINPLFDGNAVIGAPRQQVTLGADWDVPGVSGLALNARVLYTGKQYNDIANTQQLPSWTQVDVGARYLVELGSNRLLTLRARVDNLFDKSYWASTGGYPGVGYLTLGAPRTFSLTGTVNF